MQHRAARIVVSGLLAVLVGAPAAAAGPAPVPAPAASVDGPSPWAPGRILVGYAKGATKADRKLAHDAAKASRARPLTGAPGVEVVETPLGVGEAIGRLKGAKGVRYAQPDYVVRTSFIPDDPAYGLQWGLEQTSDVDIDASAAWDITTGASTIVAVIDTGVQLDHPDLAANVWTNPGEIPGNGIDDDDDGYVDDVHGWDFVDDDNDPTDENGHGTHVAGTIAAVGDNATGGTGVAFGSRVLPLRMLDADGDGLPVGRGARHCLREGARRARREPLLDLRRPDLAAAVGRHRVGGGRGPARDRGGRQRRPRRGPAARVPGRVRSAHHRVGRRPGQERHPRLVLEPRPLERRRRGSGRAHPEHLEQRRLRVSRRDLDGVAPCRRRRRAARVGAPGLDGPADPRPAARDDAPARGPDRAHRHRGHRGCRHRRRARPGSRAGRDDHRARCGDEGPARDRRPPRGDRRRPGGRRRRGVDHVVLEPDGQPRQRAGDHPRQPDGGHAPDRRDGPRRRRPSPERDRPAAGEPADLDRGRARRAQDADDRRRAGRHPRPVMGRGRGGHRRQPRQRRRLVPRGRVGVVRGPHLGRPRRPVGRGPPRDRARLEGHRRGQRRRDPRGER